MKSDKEGKGSPYEQWRRTGIVNLAIVSVCAAALLASLLAAVEGGGGSSVDGAVILLESDCTTTSRVNLALHLAINLLSTGILASSNFYMQVLSAPSRKEVDRAHAQFKSVDIGIPSVKNIRFISHFKRVCWVILLLSSFPLHLLFNSAVFETGYKGRYWNMTIASASFIEGAPFYAPGASLAPAGAPSPAYQYVKYSDEDYNHYTGLTGWGYGTPVSLEEYWNSTSSPRLELQATATDASSWTRLEPQDCMAEYLSCNARNEYSDVVLIVNSTTHSNGWARSAVFDFAAQSNLSTIWDHQVPPNGKNSLWYSTRCSVHRDTHIDTTTTCTHDCLTLLGIDRFTSSNAWNLTATTPSLSTWTIEFRPDELNVPATEGSIYGFNATLNTLQVDYCLARPLSKKCKVGVANPLLVIVLSCVVLKIAVCTIVVQNLQHVSLVTPGDAMESFISKPDPKTEGLGTLDIVDSERLEFGVRKPWKPAGGDSSEIELTPMIRARRWQTKPRSLIRIIPRAAWTRTYCLLFVAIVFVMFCMILAITNTSKSILDLPFGHSDENLTMSLAGSYVSCLLIANAPQMLLSTCYFSYNTFFTRLAVETEWNSFSLRYQPLRVSYPLGDQTSKYRLQLPYKYSVPLLAMSILLHWLVSNTIYIFITEGGYWDTYDNVDGASANLGVSADAMVALGYSPPAIVVVFIVSVVMSIFPMAWSLRKVKGDMVSGGTNSLVISAACHAAVPSVASSACHKRRTSRDRNSPKDGDCEGSKNDFLADDEEEYTKGGGRGGRGGGEEEEEEWQENREAAALLQLSRSKIKWGSVPLPSELASYMVTEGDEPVRHLTFGGLDQDVQQPLNGELYA
ncbi:hypothetical protein PFICI_08649 [Pestalotiopsis fici W106-1]|uniref:DUF6536 domain-containing protein n=1 Tax=Pestalotiopsis fici (strain W106-1 / CGMCC3.15140) TaxID=1229662 RepID=W3X0X0_PESFW|nr:uncharacterized protein PFICI_08649 [Pestalotiopsis fici W106-1]ETS78796.1 hypothetical protein PFICI_08649 [Pestalotiopsis fici W106-1]